MPTKTTFIFRKFEGYILSGIGSRSVPVGRQAGWQVGRQAGWQVGRQAGRRKRDFVQNF